MQHNLIAHIYAETKPPLLSLSFRALVYTVISQTTLFSAPLSSFLQVSWKKKLNSETNRKKSLFFLTAEEEVEEFEAIIICSSGEYGHPLLSMDKIHAQSCNQGL